jgi:hypothetical protein
VHYLHSKAIRALVKTPLPKLDPPMLATNYLTRLRQFSRTIVESYGYQWPPILDEDFPGPLASMSPTDEQAVKYTLHYIECVV